MSNAKMALNVNVDSSILRLIDYRKFLQLKHMYLLTQIE